MSVAALPIFSNSLGFLVGRMACLALLFPAVCKTKPCSYGLKREPPEGHLLWAEGRVGSLCLLDPSQQKADGQLAPPSTDN